MIRHPFSFALLAFFLAAAAACAGPASTSRYVAVLKLNGTIDPLSASFIDAGLSRAEKGGAELVVIELDTPGGMLDSMKEIVAGILASKVPVAVFVAPSGARAASAGVFVAMAAEVAAMAPATNIGAAHPVTGSGRDIGGAEEVKIVSDAAAKMRSLAALRGRNAAWAEEAVEESVSLTAEEAVKARVVDLEAADLGSLLAALDGRSVSTPSGMVTLRTAGVPVRVFEMSPGERALSFLVDPNVAYFLFLLGILGIVFELNIPGVGAPGILGGISLLIALVSFGALSVNAGGILILLLAVLFFVLDVKAPTHGALTLGGILALLVGSYLLFPPWRPVALPGSPKAAISPVEILAMSAVLAAFFAGVVRFGVRARSRRITAGSEALIGRFGTSLSALNPTGIVRLDGEDWSAKALGDEVRAGEEVQVIGVEGVHLVVMKQL